MASLRRNQFLLIANFFLAIYAVGLVQAVIELAQGESPQVLDLVRQRPTADHLRSFEDHLETRSWFARASRPWMQYVRFRAFNDAGQKAIVGRDGWWFFRPGVRYLIEPNTTDAEHHTGHDEVVSTIVSFRDQLVGRGIRLLVVPVPGKASVYPERLTRRAARGDGMKHTPTGRVIRDLSEAGVEVVDLFDSFAEARDGGSLSLAGSYYLPRDTHWTPGGLRVAAGAVARRILELGWAQRGPVEYAVKSVPVKRKGDILLMLESPRIEHLLGAQDVQCEQVIHPESNEPYQDEPGARILVLGDSFLRIYERDEPGSAGFIAHLARELGQPVASIVNDGGASTLVRQELSRKPALLADKELIVWQFVERDIRFGMEGWQDVPLPEAETGRAGMLPR